MILPYLNDLKLFNWMCKFAS